MKLGLLLFFLEGRTPDLSLFSLFDLTNISKPKDILFTIMENKEKQQTFTLYKWQQIHFCMKNCLVFPHSLVTLIVSVLCECQQCSMYLLQRFGLQRQ